MSSIGRATRNIVSGYNRDRVFQASLYAAERRPLVTDLNGAVPKGVYINRAVWKTIDNYQAAMSAPAVIENGRAAQVTLQAQWPGTCCIRMDATLSDGSVMSCWHVIRILPALYMPSDSYQNGPTTLAVDYTP